METVRSVKLLVTKFIFVIAIIIVAPNIVEAAAEQSITPSAPADIISSNELIKPAKARVNFKSFLSVSEIKNIADEKGLSLEMIEGDFTVGKLDLYDFYFVKPDMDTKSIEDDYKSSRVAYFKDLLNGESELTTEQRQELAPKFKEIKEELQRNDVGEIKIRKATFSGNEKDIQDLSQNSRVDQVNVIKEKQTSPLITPASILEKLQNKTERVNKKSASSKESIISTLINSFISVVKAAQSLPSVPRYGVSQTQASSYNGQRETTQWMKWDWISFGSNQTYEHELFYENSDGQTYLNGNSTPPGGCFPIVQYVATSFPSASRPYVDTRVGKNGLCDTSALEYTIGVFQANKLQANTWYQTYFRTTNGNANNDRFWLGGQVGHQNPTLCPSGYETWCSYGDDPSLGDRHVDLLQAWNTEVPGTKWWELGVRFCENNRAGGFGRCLDFVPGTYDLTEYNFNDILTTIIIGMGIQWRVTVYENVNPSTNQCYGNGWIFTSNRDRWEINLYENGLNFNDKASCVIVERV